MSIQTLPTIGNNLLFLGNDGIYKLKQGYLGEGTENIEKIDEILGGDLNLNNVATKSLFDKALSALFFGYRKIRGLR